MCTKVIQRFGSPVSCKTKEFEEKKENLEIGQFGASGVSLTFNSSQS